MSQTRLESEAQETAAALDNEKDRAGQLEKSLDTQRLQLEELQQAQAVAVADDREKRKTEMLAEMMAKIDTVSLALATRSYTKLIVAFMSGRCFHGPIVGETSSRSGETRQCR